MSVQQKRAAVLVAGSWGTALASVLAENGCEVNLWAKDENIVQEINTQHTNHKYLPNMVLSQSIKATSSMEEAVSGAELVLIVAPSHAMREVTERFKPHYREEMLVVHATKGFEPNTLMRMSEVICDVIPEEKGKVAVISGPSHAEEVIRKSPTTVVVASQSRNIAEAIQDYFINPYFRVYTNPDVVGVEMGGALKNIIALGAGLSDGLGYGDNAKAALLTRGLAEIARVGSAMGADQYTFAGLAGVGDLVVTCTSKHSRNWRAGYMLGQGKPLEEVLDSMGMVVEGIKTTQAAYRLSREYQVEMPIADQLYHVLFEGKHPRQAVEDLMGRGRTHELEEIVISSVQKWEQ